MDKINRMEEARTRLRAYNMAPVSSGSSMDDAGIEQDDHDEAEGLSMAAMNIAATHSDDELADLHDGMDGHMTSGRSYAAATMAPAQPGKVLRASAKNPKVRRWIKLNATKNIGRHVGHGVGLAGVAAVGTSLAGGSASAGLLAAGLIHKLHDSNSRSHSLDAYHKDATQASHYGEHHGEFVKSASKKYGVGEGVVKHALAYHAHAELGKQHNEIVSKRVGKGGEMKLHPVYNKDISDEDFHKNLGGRAKSAFIKGMIARHWK